MKRVLTEHSVRILGPIEAWCGNRRLDIGGPRQVALLAFLLVHANRAVPSDVLLDALWGPARSGIDNRLPMAVARLRKSVAPLEGPAGLALRTVGGGYLLSLEPNHLDAEVFAKRLQDGLQAAQTGPPTLAIRVLAEALSLWRGPPLAEVAYEDFAQGEIRRLLELRRAAFEARIDTELRLGRHRELIGELGRLLAEHPICERITAQLMLALYRSDRQADALEVYDHTRVQLSKQLGLEPGPTLKGLQASILAHAPSLRDSDGSPLATRSFPRWQPTPGSKPSNGRRVSRAWVAVDAEGHSRALSSTRAADGSTGTSSTTEIRWQCSSQHWQSKSWATPRTQHTAHASQRLNTVA